MKIVKWKDGAFIMPKDFTGEMPEEYADDPLAYYEEYHEGQIFEDKLLSRWGTITAQVPKKEEQIFTLLTQINKLEDKYC